MKKEESEKILDLQKQDYIKSKAEYLAVQRKLCDLLATLEATQHADQGTVAYEEIWNRVQKEHKDDLDASVAHYKQEILIGLSKVNKELAARLDTRPTLGLNEPS